MVRSVFLGGGRDSYAALVPCVVLAARLFLVVPAWWAKGVNGGVHKGVRTTDYVARSRATSSG